MNWRCRHAVADVDGDVAAAAAAVDYSTTCSCLSRMVESCPWFGLHNDPFFFYTGADAGVQESVYTSEKKKKIKRKREREQKKREKGEHGIAWSMESHVN